jgi:hypothetical protein
MVMAVVRRSERTTGSCGTDCISWTRHFTWPNVFGFEGVAQVHRGNCNNDAVPSRPVSSPDGELHGQQVPKCTGIAMAHES